MKTTVFIRSVWGVPELLEQGVEELGLHLVEVNAVMEVGDSEASQIHQQVEDGPEGD